MKEDGLAIEQPVQEFFLDLLAKGAVDEADEMYNLNLITTRQLLTLRNRLYYQQAADPNTPTITAYIHLLQERHFIRD